MEEQSKPETMLENFNLQALSNRIDQGLSIFSFYMWYDENVDPIDIYEWADSHGIDRTKVAHAWIPLKTAENPKTGLIGLMVSDEYKSLFIQTFYEYLDQKPDSVRPTRPSVYKLTNEKYGRVLFQKIARQYGKRFQ